MATNVKSDLYKNAGVDIDLATSLLGQVKAKLASARRPEMLSPIGGFGGLFQIDLSKYLEPVMVASIGLMTDRHILTVSTASKMPSLSSCISLL